MKRRYLWLALAPVLLSGCSLGILDKPLSEVANTRPAVKESSSRSEQGEAPRVREQQLQTVGTQSPAYYPMGVSIDQVLSGIADQFHLVDGGTRNGLPVTEARTPDGSIRIYFHGDERNVSLIHCELIPNSAEQAVNAGAMAAVVIANAAGANVAVEVSEALDEMKAAGSEKEWYLIDGYGVIIERTDVKRAFTIFVA